MKSRGLVAITRPAEASRALASRLRDAGYEVLLAPAIRRVEPESWARLDQGIAELLRGGYRGVLFTSPAAVEFFFRRLSAAVPGASFIGAVGEGTASALRKRGVRVDVIAPGGTGASLAEAVVARLGEELEGAGFLQPRAAEGREELSSGLAARGARVDVVPAYRTLPASSAELAELGAALAADRVDIVVFASPSAVSAVFAAVGDLGAARVVAIGETTADALRQRGVSAVEVAEMPDDDSLFDAIVRER